MIHHDMTRTNYGGFKKGGLFLFLVLVFLIEVSNLSIHRLLLDLFPGQLN